MINAQQVINNTIKFVKETAIYKRIVQELDESILFTSLKGHFSTKVNITFTEKELKESGYDDYLDLKHIFNYILYIYHKEGFDISFYAEHDFPYKYTFFIKWYLNNKRQEITYSVFDSLVK